MSEVMKERREVIVASWGIEADHPRNCDLVLQGIPGIRLRSAISATRTVKDVNGNTFVPQDQSAYLGMFPPLPGMQLHVNPSKLSYRIIDPLSDNEELCEKIRTTMNRIGPFRSEGKLKGVQTQSGELDPHRMKTLIREMLWLVNSGEAKVIYGNKPEIEMIDQLPGHYLLNPGARVANLQPMFEKDWLGWLEKMSSVGG